MSNTAEPAYAAQLAGMLIVMEEGNHQADDLALKNLPALLDQVLVGVDHDPRISNLRALFADELRKPENLHLLAAYLRHCWRSSFLDLLEATDYWDRIATRSPR
jgi:hypothetical protein